MDPIYAGDDVIDNMISGNKALAVVYSGDASYIISENPNLDYFTPEQGPTDGMMQWLSQRTAAKYSLPMNLLIYDQ